MSRLSLILLIAACGGSAGSTPEPRTPNPEPAADPFAADAVWRFAVEHESYNGGEEPPTVTRSEMTCELTAGTLDCTGDDSFFEGVWIKDAAGYHHDGVLLSGAPNGDLWCTADDRSDEHGRAFYRELCLGADGIEYAVRREEKPAGNGVEIRFERLR